MPLAASADPAPLRPIEVTRLFAGDPGVAPIVSSSHGQSVVANVRGIFATFVADRNKDPRHRRWTLQRSTDGGKTFTEIYASSGFTRGAIIETDANANIYLFVQDYAAAGRLGSVVWYKFAANNGYKAPVIKRFGMEAAGKYTAIYDPSRRQLHYMGYGSTPFLVIDTNGKVVRRRPLLRAGAHATAEYPYLAMDGRRLYVAWTTSPPNPTPQTLLYYDIHFIYSDDGAATWRNAADVPLSPPFAADDTGPATEIVHAQYIGVPHLWLANMLARRGFVHFMYMTGDGRRYAHQVYQRFSMSPFSEISYLEDRWGGERLKPKSLYGFFAHAAGQSGNLYAVSAQHGRLVVLTSGDDGASWTDYALGPAATQAVYITPGRTIVPGYGIIGLFVDRATNDVYFFRVPSAGASSDKPRG